MGKYKKLLQKSEKHVSQYPHCIQEKWSFNVFDEGGVWMSACLGEIGARNITNVGDVINFKWYGTVKYLSCLMVFGVSFLLLLNVNVFLIPFSLLLFYIVEVHFLFLFPLLIDGEKYAIRKSILYTYQYGVLKAILVVIPIAFYMLKGLLNRRFPYYNWQIGCLAILFLYVEIKDEKETK